MYLYIACMIFNRLMSAMSIDGIWQNNLIYFEIRRNAASHFGVRISYPCWLTAFSHSSSYTHWLATVGSFPVLVLSLVLYSYSPCLQSEQLVLWADVYSVLNFSEVWWAGRKFGRPCVAWVDREGSLIAQDCLCWSWLVKGSSGYRSFDLAFLILYPCYPISLYPVWKGSSLWNPIIDLIKDSTESQIAVFIYLIQTDERAIAAFCCCRLPAS